MRGSDLLAFLEPLTRPNDVAGPPAKGPGADSDVAFQHMVLSHSLRLSSADDWCVVAALAVCMQSRGARLEHLTVRRTGEVTTVMCRLSGLSSENIHACAQQISSLDGVNAVSVEHILTRVPGSGQDAGLTTPH